MPKAIILDTSPLSNSVVQAAKPRQIPTLSQKCRQWIDDCEMVGYVVMVPAVAYYEALRELELRGATGQIKRLKDFGLNPRRFIPLTTRHLETAARLWAKARKSGKPTSDPHALDADVILAAQALSLGLSTSDYIVATTNQNHFAQFVPCDHWTNIKP